MSKRLYYFIMIPILVAAFAHANWRFLRTADKRDPDPSHYIYMSPAERATEFASLKQETEHPVSLEPERYFPVLVRFRKLEDAIERARIEEHGMTQAAMHGTPVYVNDNMQVDWILQNYVSKRDQAWHLDGTLTRERIDSIRAASGADELPFQHNVPGDPMTVPAWIFFYGFTVLFTAGLFIIRNEEMGSSSFKALTDLKFYLYSFAFLPGLWKYPTDLDIKSQVARMHRLVTGVLFSSLSLAACGVAKRVKTEPDERRKDAEYAFVVKANTITWPDYTGNDAAIFHPAPVQQSVVTFALPRNTYAGIWNSVPLGGRALAPNFGYEVDFFGGINRALPGNVNFNGDISYIDVTPLAHGSGDVLQLSATFGRDLKLYGHTFTPFVEVQHVERLGEGKPGGVFWHEGVRTGFGLKGWTGGINAELFHDSGAFGFNPGTILKTGASIGKKIGSGSRLDFLTRSFLPLSTNDNRGNILEGGLSLSWSTAH